MTGRAYTGEVLIQVWLKSIDKTSECTKRKFEKILAGFMQLYMTQVPASHEKVCHENKTKGQTKKK